LLFATFKRFFAMTSAPPPAADLQQTPLHALHLELGARMVAFAGYDMPVSYPSGINAEHLHARHLAALFDVSHMGQISLQGADVAELLESLMPIDVLSLRVGQQRYGLFTNEAGGILDDLMVVRREQDWLLVVNAARKAADTQHLITRLGERCTVEALPNQALLALQGPQAEAALSALNPFVRSLVFMTGAALTLVGIECFVTRSGYTGEDGFEISLPADRAEELAQALLAQAEVKPAGLGARDTLRLEAGLCLYGHDMDERTTPIEAGLGWAIQKVRRLGGERHGGYPGAEVLDAQWLAGVSSKRVGLKGLERVPVREGTVITDVNRHAIGRVTSGTLAPTVNEPIAMAYLPANHAQLHSEVYAQVRGQSLPMRVCAMPFVPHRYRRAV
jgi:aminomethyltransferase